MKSAEDTLLKKRDESNNMAGDEGEASEMSCFKIQSGPGLLRMGGL